MWHKDTKGVNAVGKIASVDAGLPQAFYLLKKKNQCLKHSKWSVHICMYNGLLVITILPFVTTWIDLVKLVKTEKDKYHMISLTCEI